jgi:uncharacterized membrane protein
MVAIGLFGIYSLYSILRNVLSLKEYPAEERILRQDIQRARDFYQEKSVKL